ncbi:MAG: prepilin-type N-terminal cleavage/methylation domain-containing protein [bacterium]|nr:prepilin-type N-terminal cleavage/methylation domain-containing protein [bacterium]
MCPRSRARSRGFGLVEVLVACLVLAAGVTAAQRLVAARVDGLAHDAARLRAARAAEGVLTAAALATPGPGTHPGSVQGLRAETEIAGTPHPALRLVRVRVWPDDGGEPVELVEVMRVPPG